MIGLGQAVQARIERCAERSGVGGAIGMPADRPIDGTMIHAGAAADALQDFAYRAGDEGAAAVVDEYDVKMFRAIGVCAALRAAHEADIRGDLLTRGRARQEP